MSTQSPMADNEAGADRLGGTVIIGGDMPVHRLGFGAMRLCGPGVWGEPADPAQSKGVLKRVLELGITLIDRPTLTDRRSTNVSSRARFIPIPRRSSSQPRAV